MEYLKIDINISIFILYVLKCIIENRNSKKSFPLDHFTRAMSKRDRFVLTRRLKARCKCRN